MKKNRRDGSLITTATFFIGTLFMLAHLVNSEARAGQQSVEQEGPFEAEHHRALLKNPEGLSFTLRLKDGKAQFKQGEIIRIELGFASRVPNTYRLDAATYDRSGRLGIDTFYLDPRSSVVDPLRDYFSSVFGFIGGGGRAMPVLEEKPYTIPLELNEWFRLRHQSIRFPAAFYRPSLY